MCVCVLQVEKLSAELSTIQKGSEEEQEAQRKFRELQAELSATRAQLRDCQDGTQEAQKRVGAVTAYLHHVLKPKAHRIIAPCSSLGDDSHCTFCPQ